MSEPQLDVEAPEDPRLPVAVYADDLRADARSADMFAGLAADADQDRVAAFLGGLSQGLRLAAMRTYSLRSDIPQPQEPPDEPTQALIRAAAERMAPLAQSLRDAGWQTETIVHRDPDTERVTMTVEVELRPALQRPSKVAANEVAKRAWLDDGIVEPPQEGE